MSRSVLALVTDLFFVAKMEAAARGANVQLAFARSDDELLERARALPSLVVVDLNDRVVDAVGAVETLRRDPATASIPVLGFLSHVDVQTAERARQVGCQRVMARSEFSRRLVELLRG
jgi:CheY-like chemotaxis protein